MCGQRGDEDVITQADAEEEPPGAQAQCGGRWPGRRAEEVSQGSMGTLCRRCRYPPPPPLSLPCCRLCRAATQQAAAEQAPGPHQHGEDDLRTSGDAAEVELGAAGQQAPMDAVPPSPSPAGIEEGEGTPSPGDDVEARQGLLKASGQLLGIKHFDFPRVIQARAPLGRAAPHNPHPPLPSQPTTPTSCR